MDQNRFDLLTRALSGAAARRDVFRLAYLGLCLGVACPAVSAEANKRKRKRKHRVSGPRPNAFGCLNVGDPCTSAGQCCSSICEGKRCRAHDVGSCSAGKHLEACGGTNVACITSLDEEGLCATTTGKAGYCAAATYCVACATDADCQAAEGGVLGPRAACIRCTNCAEFGGTGCVIPYPQSMKASARP